MLRHKGRHSDRNRVGVPAGQPRDILGTSPLLNLVEPQPGKVSVTCLLTPEGRIWGRHGQDEAAVMHLSMKAKEPIGLKLKSFELQISLVTNSALASGTTNSSGTLPSPVWHLVAPAPSFVAGQPCSSTDSRGLNHQLSSETAVGGGEIDDFPETVGKSIQRSWTFRADPGNDAGPVTAAKWTFESHSHSPQVGDCGPFHGGMALRHDGQPFVLSCHVHARLRQDSRMGRWRTKRPRATMWQVEPQASSDDIRAHIEQLDAEMKRRNKEGAATPGKIMLAGKCPFAHVSGN